MIPIIYICIKFKNKYIITELYFFQAQIFRVQFYFQHIEFSLGLNYYLVKKNNSINIDIE